MLFLQEKRRKNAWLFKKIEFHISTGAFGTNCLVSSLEKVRSARGPCWFCYLKRDPAIASQFERLLTGFGSFRVTRYFFSKTNKSLSMRSKKGILWQKDNIWKLWIRVFGFSAENTALEGQKMLILIF